MSAKSILCNLSFILIALLPSLGRCGLSYVITIPDSSGVTLSFPLFIDKVIAHHPIAKQAWLLDEYARMEIRTARGNFDPSFNYSLNQKNYDGTTYFINRTTSLKVPIWPGADIKAGLEQNSGSYLDPSDKTPVEGLLYAGLSVQLGQGLLMDERRAALRIAQATQGMTLAEQIKIINKLLFQASKDYWTWAETWQKVKILEEGLELAERRNQAIQRGITGGQFSGLDSIEASTEVFRRKAQLLESQLMLQQTTLGLGLYLWDENGAPQDLQVKVKPDAPPTPTITWSADTLETLLRRVETQHPEVLKTTFKLQQLDFERRLAREGLKPVVSIDFYPFLQSASNQTTPLGMRYFQNNHKLGVQIYVPLLLRKARGKLEQIQLKTQQSQYELAFVRQERRNQLEQSWQQYSNTYLLAQVYRQQLEQATLLRDGEDFRFQQGESSFFLVNVRERALLEASIKELETRVKFQKSEAELHWATGIPQGLSNGMQR